MDRGGTGIGGSLRMTVCAGTGAGTCGGRSRRIRGAGVGSGGACCRTIRGGGAGD